MATAFKLTLLFVLLFILLNNAKAGKPFNEEGIDNGNGISVESHINEVLHGK